MRSPAKTAGDLAAIVQRDIQQKTRADAQGDIAHFLPDRIPLGDAKGRAHIADLRRAVVASAPWRDPPRRA